LGALCDASGLLVVATPYDVGSDHDSLSRAAAATLRSAVAAVSARDQLPASLPHFAVGHSLGAKLLLLLASASEPACRYEAVSLVAFNNASATDTVRLLESFARELLAQRGGAGGAEGPNAGLFDTLLRAMPAVGAAAERAASAAGIEFTPSPSSTLSRARSGYAAPRTLLVKHESDSLDMCDELQAALEARPGVRLLRRPGNHLSPVAIALAPAEASPLGRLGRSVGAVRVGDAAAAAELATLLGAWLVDGATARGRAN